MLLDKIQSFRKNLVRNNLITVLCLLLVLVCFMLNYLERREVLREKFEYAYYVSTSGEVIPARYAQRRDNIEIEIKHHLSMFVDYWYSLTQDNWKQKAEAAGWLGGNSIRDLYIARKKQGFFNYFIQSNASTTAQLVEMQISPNQDGTYSFEIVVDMEDRVDASVRVWRVLGSGRIQLVDRSWPNNPHGLWIEPYLENKIIEIKPDEK